MACSWCAFKHYYLEINFRKWSNCSHIPPSPSTPTPPKPQHPPTPKACFVFFLLGMVKNYLSQLDIRIFKSVISQKWLRQSAWFFDILKGNVKGYLITFSWMGSKMFSANRITKFLSKLYLKKEMMNQSEFLYGDIGWRMVKDDLKIFTLTGSKMLSVNQIS